MESYQEIEIALKTLINNQKPQEYRNETQEIFDTLVMKLQAFSITAIRREFLYNLVEIPHVSERLIAYRNPYTLMQVREQKIRRLLNGSKVIDIEHNNDVFRHILYAIRDTPITYERNYLKEHGIPTIAFNDDVGVPFLEKFGYEHGKLYDIERMRKTEIRKCEERSERWQKLPKWLRIKIMKSKGWENFEKTQTERQRPCPCGLDKSLCNYCKWGK